MQKRKILVFAAVLLMVSLSLTACAQDLTKGKTPAEIVIASGEAMQNLKSYTFDAVVKIAVPGGEEIGLENIEMTGSGKSTTEPLQAEMNFDIKMGQMSMTTQIYVIVEDNKIVEYINNPLAPAQWMKMELPMSDGMMEMINPANSLELTKEMITDAKILGEEEINKVKHVILEVTVDPKAIQKIFPLSGDNQAFPPELAGQLALLGELKYKMWVRKDNLYGTKMEMDLGSMLKNLFAQSPEMPPEMQNITAHMTMVYKDFDHPITITIPDDAKNNAVDISLMEQPPAGT